MPGTRGDVPCLIVRMSAEAATVTVAVAVLFVVFASDWAPTTVAVLATGPGAASGPTATAMVTVAVAPTGSAPIARRDRRSCGAGPARARDGRDGESRCRGVGDDDTGRVGRPVVGDGDGVGDPTGAGDHRGRIGRLRDGEIGLRSAGREGGRGRVVAVDRIRCERGGAGGVRERRPAGGGWVDTGGDGRRPRRAGCEVAEGALHGTGLDLARPGRRLRCQPRGEVVADAHRRR